ncbi:ATP-binding protein [Alterisphingorhabdus coralli]|uniref:histidine kinase n=1 Tax=Alterisphingorhabdus coralli TaxID=3071408 RepID=A0AA97F581_9SPHN|nr:ATP-binding protein [Parasphingorhabdus sp. SCSIO 66989]WOE74236.1 ATP-binding protein [Parasphingorhabdus sp. SCSIO 66989]
MRDFFSPEIRPLRLFLAAMIIVLAPVLGLYIDGPVERSAIIIAAGLVALAIGLDQKTPAVRSVEAASPILESDQAEWHELPELRSLIEGIPDPMLILSGMTVIASNAAAKAMLGNEIDNEDVRLVIRHPSATDAIVRQREEPLHRPIELIGIGSRDQRWELNLRSVGDGDYCILYLWDRSSSYAVEKMRTDFVANVSHELRTPLSSIIGFIETLADKEAGGDKKTRKRFLKVMAGEAHRMQQLISDLISLSRIEAEKFKPPENLVDMADLLDEVKVIFDDRYDRNIILDIDPSVRTVRGDRSQLSQMIQNLVSNSIKYGRPETPIMIRLKPSRTGSMARLAVIDEGDGIDPKHLPRLTERFYRVDSGRSRQIGGTGLGLSIVKHIVERHGGRLEINSTVGKGTNITISLPAARIEVEDSDGDDSNTEPEAQSAFS